MNRLLLLFLLGFGLNAFTTKILLGQNSVIEVKKEQKQSVVESWIAFKGADGKVTKTLTVSEENPYKSRTSSSSYRSFTEGLLSNVTSSAIAVSYKYKVYSQEREQLQDLGESTLIVYDKTGKELFKQVINADNASEPLVAPNSNYVGVYFGGLVYDAVTKKIGFSIYDLRTKSILFEISTKDIAGASVYEDVFVFSVPETGRDQPRTYFVFDTRTGILYRKTYSLGDVRAIKRFNNDGIVFLLPPDKERVETYTKYFAIIEQ